MYLNWNKTKEIIFLIGNTCPTGIRVPKRIFVKKTLAQYMYIQDIFHMLKKKKSQKVIKHIMHIVYDI